MLQPETVYFCFFLFVMNRVCVVYSLFATLFEDANTWNRRNTRRMRYAPASIKSMFLQGAQKHLKHGNLSIKPLKNMVFASKVEKPNFVQQKFIFEVAEFVSPLGIPDSLVKFG